MSGRPCYMFLAILPKRAAVIRNNQVKGRSERNQAVAQKYTRGVKVETLRSLTVILLIILMIYPCFLRENNILKLYNLKIPVMLMNIDYAFKFTLTKNTKYPRKSNLFLTLNFLTLKTNIKIKTHTSIEYVYYIDNND